VGFFLRHYCRRSEETRDGEGGELEVDLFSLMSKPHVCIYDFFPPCFKHIRKGGAFSPFLRSLWSFSKHRKSIGIGIARLKLQYCRVC